MIITNTDVKVIREKLKAPLGFKGNFLTELWQVVVKVQTDTDLGIGVGVQSVLWSDPEVFAHYGEADGNRLMLRITERALELLRNKEITTPIEATEYLYDELITYSSGLTFLKGKLKKTFIRNALVAVDNALWQLYAKENNTEDLLRMIPNCYQDALCKKQKQLCNIPLISYGVKEKEIEELLNRGCVLLKIKIGFDNGGKFSKQEMCEWDKKRLFEIHKIASKYQTNQTVSGNVLYYLDANGKYDSKERLREFLDYAQEIGAIQRIVLLEEPFAEEEEIFVGDLPVRMAADESVHSLCDVKKRVSMGYQAIALKPIAKTLSETLKILSAANEMGAICFCADLTVNPLLLEWNKNIAARIQPLPEMKVGVVESNGEQNYVNWQEMKTYLPMYEEHPVIEKDYMYILGEEFFENSGGIFLDSKYYCELFDK